MSEKRGATQVDADALQPVRRRYEEATRRARSARIAAAEPLRARARLRTRRFRLSVIAVVVVVIALISVIAALALHNRSAAARSEAATAALDASRSAITTLLTADPADGPGYVDRALSVSTGHQRDRLTAARDALAAEVAAQTRPSSGEVLSAGLITDPGSDDVGAQARVLVVAEATDPQLLGGDTRRVTVEVTMTREPAGWLISSAGPA
ncbi:hypothetical protein [Gordonia sp. OPL2]|uniref:hypothetical protein n=1 Tax=Gordonia sp. OPL2 TaxID=2486274 RepID=UPI0021CCB8E6|nr:hypothetical protein [Gordonia sp. OPL2]